MNEVITQRSHVMVKITHRTTSYFTRITNIIFVKTLMIMRIHIDIVGSSSRKGDCKNSFDHCK